MDDETPGEGLGAGFDLEVAAASLRAESDDVGFLLSLLVNQLSAALGSRLAVERRGGLLRRGQGEIRAVRIDLGGVAFEAEVVDKSLSCTIGRSSGGIRIRSEKVDLGEWLKRLLQALQTEATHSAQTRQALEGMVFGQGAI